MTDTESILIRRSLLLCILELLGFVPELAQSTQPIAKRLICTRAKNLEQILLWEIYGPPPPTAGEEP